MATASHSSSPSHPDPDYAPPPAAGSHPEVFHDSRPGGSVSVLAGDQRLVLSVTCPQLHCGSHRCCPHSHPDHYSHPDPGHPLHSGPTGASPGLGREITVDLSFEGRGRCSGNIHHTAARSNSIAIDRLGTTAGGFESFPDVVSNYTHPLQQDAPTLRLNPSQQLHHHDHNYDSAEEDHLARVASSATNHQRERPHNHQQHWASAQHETTTTPTCGVTVGAAGQRVSDEAARWATEGGVERNRTRQSTTTSSSSSSSTSSIRSVLIVLALLAILSSLVGVVLMSRGHISFVYAVAFMGLGLMLSTGVCVARKCVALTSQPPETAPARRMIQRFPSGTRQRQRRPRRWWTHGGERLHRSGRRNAYSSASPGPWYGGAGLLEFQHLASSPPPYDDVEGLHACQTRSAGDTTTQPYTSYSVYTALTNGSGDCSYPTRDLAPDSPPPSYRSVASSSRAGVRVFFPDPVESGSSAPPPPPAYWSPSASSVGSEPDVFNAFLFPWSQSAASNSPPPYRSGAGSQRRRPRLYGVDESEADSHRPPSRLSVDDEAADDDQPSAGPASADRSPLPDPHRSGTGRRQRPRLHVYDTETSPVTSPTVGQLY